MVVRTVRQQVLMRRNDLRDAMGQLSAALEALHALGPGAIVPPAAPAPPPGAGPAGPPAPLPPAAPVAGVVRRPFALVDAVSPGSPAADAGLVRGDRVVGWGHLQGVPTAAPAAGAGGDSSSGEGAPAAPSLSDIAAVVRAHEGSPVPVVVLRDAGAIGAQPQQLALTLTPRSGWGGPGLLGCHVVPL